MRRLLVVAAVLAITGVATGAPEAPVTLARITSSATSTGTVTSGTLAPPTSLSASVAGSVVTLTWTPTTTTSATGYDILRSTTSGSGYSVIASVTPRTLSTTTDSPGNGTFYYVLQAAYQSWRSVSSNQATAVVAVSLSTGYQNCASTLADTGGDNNGYETTPGNGCATDGAIARDANSGTNNVNSCTDAGKDRHRFWGYGFGLPGSVSSVNGIELQLVAGRNNATGTAIICAQLSWDGGTSWTATKSVTLTSNALTTYTLGGTADTWGQSWDTSRLNTTNFRVRLIDVATVNNKRFDLDSVRLQVTYTP